MIFDVEMKGHLLLDLSTMGDRDLLMKLEARLGQIRYLEEGRAFVAKPETLTAVGLTEILPEMTWEDYSSGLRARAAAAKKEAA